MTMPLMPLKYFLRTKRSGSRSGSDGGAAVPIARHLRARQFTSLQSMLLKTPPDEYLALDDNNILPSPTSSPSSTPHAAAPPSAAAIVTPETILHHAAECHAPLAIISLLAERYPASLAHRSDDDGRYPLHVAVMNGSRPDVVSYLVENSIIETSVAGVPDSMGRTPMHHVGMRYIANFEHDPDDRYRNVDDFLRYRDECMLDVVKILRDAAPGSVNLEDVDGRNAIEYALEDERVNLKVLKEMQAASRDDWRRRSTNAITAAATISASGRAPLLLMLTPDPSAAAAAAAPELAIPGRRRRHRDMVEDMRAMSFHLRRECGGGGGGVDGSIITDDDGPVQSNKTVDDAARYGRVHVHRSRAEANTRAAMTA